MTLVPDGDMFATDEQVTQEMLPGESDRLPLCALRGQAAGVVSSIDVKAERYWIVIQP